MIAEGSLEVKLPTIWTDEAAGVGRGREEKKYKRKSQQKEDQAREKVEKSRNTIFPNVSWLRRVEK